MQSDGNFVTYREPGTDVVFSADVADPQDPSSFFFVIDCDGNRVAIYDVDLMQNGSAERLWMSPETFNPAWFDPTSASLFLCRRARYIQPRA
jgi:hypothetical protein